MSCDVDLVVQTHTLTAGYGELPIVRGLDLTVGAGEVVALLGPNGAGKTTTLMTIAGVLKPLAGTVEVLGQDIARLASHGVADLGMAIVPEDRGLFRQLSVIENLRLRWHKESTVGFDDVFRLFPVLREMSRRKVGLLSGGEQQMVAIGGALIADPRCLLIDEMSLGLAPIIVDELLAVVGGLADQRGVGVLLVEQHVHSALEIADRCYVLNHGEVVTSRTVAELQADTALLEASYLGDADLDEELTEPREIDP